MGTIKSLNKWANAHSYYPLDLLQIALGHRNITNTMIYADFVYSQDEMRKLIL